VAIFSQRPTFASKGTMALSLRFPGYGGSQSLVRQRRKQSAAWRAQQPSKAATCTTMALARWTVVLSSLQTAEKLPHYAHKAKEVRR
jgi:hypothetical protein